MDPGAHVFLRRAPRRPRRRCCCSSSLERSYGRGRGTSSCGHRGVHFPGGTLSRDAVWWSLSCWTRPRQYFPHSDCLAFQVVWYPRAKNWRCDVRPCGFGERTRAAAGGSSFELGGEPALWAPGSAGRLRGYVDCYRCIAPGDSRLSRCEKASAHCRKNTPGPEVFLVRAKGGLSQRSPTNRLLFGLVITLAAVVAYASYIAVQLAGLRKLQSEMVDRNRKDSLQLLRIQNDLNSVALAMRDMLDTTERYPLTAWTAQFERMRQDLDTALKLEESLAVVSRTPDQRKFLAQSVAQFWDAVNRMFKLAEDHEESEAREQIRLTLQARQQALSTAVSRLLVENNEGEEQAAASIAKIYDGVQRQLYLFLAATLIAIVLTSLYLIRSNRQIFARLAELSEQRSDLAQKLISTQESTLRHISRELHDEFGQVLTAIGSMLRRAGKHAGEGNPLHTDLKEVQEIAQTTLNNIRTLSQALHPVLLEEAGLESTLDWYILTVGRQAGIELHYEKSGKPFPVEPSAGVHIYRVLQEALNNVSRHSGARDAWVRLKFSGDSLELEVEDHGSGFVPEKMQRGIGLRSEERRAELIGGTLAIIPRQEGGTQVRLQIPRAKVESHAA